MLLNIVFFLQNKADPLQNKINIAQEVRRGEFKLQCAEANVIQTLRGVSMYMFLINQS